MSQHSMLYVFADCCLMISAQFCLHVGGRWHSWWLLLLLLVVGSFAHCCLQMVCCKLLVACQLSLGIAGGCWHSCFLDVGRLMLIARHACCWIIVVACCWLLVVARLWPAAFWCMVLLASCRWLADGHSRPCCLVLILGLLGSLLLLVAGGFLLLGVGCRPR